MTQKQVVNEHEISENVLFANLSFKALVITGIGLMIIAAIILAYIWPVTENSPEASVVSPVPYTHALEMQYAKPWLDAQNSPAAIVEYTNALEMQYAKPWLSMQSSAEYNNALEILYANPWLLNSEINICHSRMDYAYACQYGRWIPEK